VNVGSTKFEVIAIKLAVAHSCDKNASWTHSVTDPVLHWIWFTQCTAYGPPSGAGAYIKRQTADAGTQPLTDGPIGPLNLPNWTVDENNGQLDRIQWLTHALKCSLLPCTLQTISLRMWIVVDQHVKQPADVDYSCLGAVRHRVRGAETKNIERGGAKIYEPWTRSIHS
jgi:hypothetical protein